MGECLSKKREAPKEPEKSKLKASLDDESKKQARVSTAKLHSPDSASITPPSTSSLSSQLQKVRKKGALMGNRYTASNIITSSTHDPKPDINAVAPSTLPPVDGDGNKIPNDTNMCIACPPSSRTHNNPSAVPTDVFPNLTQPDTSTLQPFIDQHQRSRPHSRTPSAKSLPQDAPLQHTPKHTSNTISFSSSHLQSTVSKAPTKQQTPDAASAPALQISDSTSSSSIHPRSTPDYIPEPPPPSTNPRPPTTTTAPQRRISSSADHFEPHTRYPHRLSSTPFRPSIAQQHSSSNAPIGTTTSRDVLGVRSTRSSRVSFGSMANIRGFLDACGDPPPTPDVGDNPAETLLGKNPEFIATYELVDIVKVGPYWVAGRITRKTDGKILLLKRIIKKQIPPEAIWAPACSGNPTTCQCTCCNVEAKKVPLEVIAMRYKDSGMPSLVTVSEDDESWYLVTKLHGEKERKANSIRTWTKNKYHEIIWVDYLPGMRNLPQSPENQPGSQQSSYNEDENKSTDTGESEEMA